MKTALFVVVGALVFGVLAFVVAVAVSQYQVQVLHYSPAKADVFIDAFLMVWPVTILLGGYAGYRLHRRRSELDR